eukprot:403334725
MYVDLDPTRQGANFECGLYLAQRLNFAICVSYFKDNGIGQVVIQLVIAIGIIVYTAILRPYASKMSNILVIYNQVSYLVMLIAVIPLCDRLDDQDQKRQLGVFMCFWVILNFIVNWSYQIYLMITTAISLRKSKLEAKAKYSKELQNAQKAVDKIFGSNKSNSLDQTSANLMPALGISIKEGTQKQTESNKLLNPNQNSTINLSNQTQTVSLFETIADNFKIEDLTQKRAYIKYKTKILQQKKQQSQLNNILGQKNLNNQNRRQTIVEIAKQANIVQKIKSDIENMQNGKLQQQKRQITNHHQNSFKQDYKQEAIGRNNIPPVIKQDKQQPMHNEHIVDNNIDHNSYIFNDVAEMEDFTNNHLNNNFKELGGKIGSHKRYQKRKKKKVKSNFYLSNHQQL